jgi:hypothetical protein
MNTTFAIRTLARGDVPEDEAALVQGGVVVEVDVVEPFAQAARSAVALYGLLQLVDDLRLQLRRVQIREQAFELRADLGSSIGASWCLKCSRNIWSWRFYALAWCLRQGSRPADRTVREESQGDAPSIEHPSADPLEQAGFTRNVGERNDAIDASGQIRYLLPYRSVRLGNWQCSDVTCTINIPMQLKFRRG